MTDYGVDVDELAAVIAAMDSCGQDLAVLATEVEAAQGALHAEWAGLASEAHTASHAAWRSSFADMRSALTELRAVGDTARANYSAAVETNLTMWREVG